jgi:hypothetical protein
MSEEKLTQERKEELMKEVQEKVNALNETEKIEDLIKDNKLEFEVKETTYRVRFPSFKERSEIRKLRSKKNLELLRDGSFLPRNALTELYKERGIDIAELETGVKRLIKEKENLDCLHVKAQGESKKDVRNQIEKIKTEINKLNIEISTYLEDSLENELIDYSNTCHLCTVLEKKEGDNWVKAFKNFDEFYNSNDDELIVKATYYNTILIRHNNLGW